MLNPEIVFRDAHRLLCIFMANKTIFDLTDENQRVFGGSQTSTELLFRLHHTCMDDEINHTLINLAICNRTHMEWQKKHHNKDYPNFVCGELFKKYKKKEEKPIDLTFREACNKIIHAEKYSSTYLQNDEVKGHVDRPQPQMEPLHYEMWIYGKYDNFWKAELNILDFIRATLENFDFY